MLRDDLHTLIGDALAGRHLLEHRFYRRWEAGELAPEELAAYAEQYRHFEAALPELLAGAVAQLADGPARRALAANLADERGNPAPHLALFDEFAAAVGASPDAPATPATASLVAHYRAAGALDVAALVAALAAYEVQSPAIAVSKAEGLRSRYGLTHAQTRFWDVHGVVDQDHASWTLDALADLGPSGAQVRAAAGAAADAWWAFLDERQEAAPASVAAS